jgi:hypothetical protein
MKADVQYNDFVGTAAADISDFLGSKYGDSLDSFRKYFKIDETRFKVVGISIYGTDSFYISFLCVDKQRSTEEKEHLVSMSIDINNEKEILDFLFKRLHIVLHSKFDDKYPRLKYDEDVNYSDYHETENEE